MTRALICVDVQRDFCEGGSLAVSGGKEVAKRIALYRGTRQYDQYLATKDAHLVNHDNSGHFGNPPDYVDSWPAHCIEGRSGFHFQAPVRHDMFHELFKKGRGYAAYSGFDGVGQTTKMTLREYLLYTRVDSVDVCGIAYDYCVLATARDAVKFGFKTRVLRDLCASIRDKDEVDEVFWDYDVEVVDSGLVA